MSSDAYRDLGGVDWNDFVDEMKTEEKEAERRTIREEWEAFLVEMRANTRLETEEERNARLRQLARETREREGW